MALSRSRSRSRSRTAYSSFARPVTTFPVDNWEVWMEVAAELPAFFEKGSAWRNLMIPPPGPDETARELRTLMAKQMDSLGREARRREIELEANEDCPNFDRLLMFDTHPGSYLLMQLMMELGRIIASHYKKRYMRARPSMLMPQLRPMIKVPAHASFPSGHALQYFLIAKALASVVHDHQVGCELFKIAERVAENREWAGVHFESDTLAGKRIAMELFPQVQDAFAETFLIASREWL